MSATKPRNRPHLTRTRTTFNDAIIRFSDRPGVPTESITSDFSIGRKIGFSSQLSSTYRVRRRKDKRIFACKVINKAKLHRLQPNRQRALLLNRMQHDIYALYSMFPHNNVSQIVQTYEDISYLYIVNQYCEGGNLIERMRERGKLFTESEACNITRMILEGLWHVRVSCKIAHGNLKASNILFTTSNDNDIQIKITDFGMSKILEPMREMMGNSIDINGNIGCDYRISSMNLNNNNNNNNNSNKNNRNKNKTNERRYRNRNYSSHGYYGSCEPYSLDMWSLGVILHLMLFGFTPFGVDTTEYYGEQEMCQIVKNVKWFFVFLFVFFVCVVFYFV